MFLLVFLLLVFTPPIFGCGEKITAQTGQVKSPNYPNGFYPSNKDCIWDITVSGSSIKLYFESRFGIEVARGCGYDYVQVHSLTSRGASQIGKYCGSQSPGTITISSNHIRVKFHSDSSATDKGFSANFSAVVNGGWSDWGDYTDSGQCSNTCGTGTKRQTRTRQCDNPAPLGGGSQCSGSSSEDQTVACKLRECPVHGGWSTWSDYEPGQCSVSCGTGYQNETSSRDCNNPTPSNGGEDCQGDDVRTRETTCSMDPCPRICELDGTKMPYARDFTKYNECQDNQLVLKTCPYKYSWDQNKQKCVKVCPLFVVKSLADPNDCYKYIQCVWGFYIVMSCPSGTAYAADLKVCKHVRDVQCQY
ncbi:hypothetical protein SNE40_000876 [Patella caerulea]|uniref:Uncharacterized protein n=1 Tax=Patella caerulea TaxID=87958 RepID=A0AAN8Q2T9_PATCE